MKSLQNVLIILVFLTSNVSLGEIRIIDAFIGEDECTTEHGVLPPATPTPAPSATPNPRFRETEELEFSSLAPVQIYLQCPKGFEAKNASFSTDGGICGFIAANPAQGSERPLAFSCHKQNAEDCGGQLLNCKAEASIDCAPLTRIPEAKTNPECRLPGTYGQISSLSTGLLALATLKSATAQVQLLSDGNPVPAEASNTGQTTSNSTPSDESSPELVPPPTQQRFPGKSTPSGSSAPK